jgi:hypothetical protein
MLTLQRLATIHRPYLEHFLTFYVEYQSKAEKLAKEKRDQVAKQLTQKLAVGGFAK